MKRERERETELSIELEIYSVQLITSKYLILHCNIFVNLTDRIMRRD